MTYLKKFLSFLNCKCMLLDIGFKFYERIHSAIVIMPDNFHIVSYFTLLIPLKEEHYDLGGGEWEVSRF
jgi:hypothetical protein